MAKLIQTLRVRVEAFLNLAAVEEVDVLALVAQNLVDLPLGYCVEVPGDVGQIALAVILFVDRVAVEV
jgi:hypothetical protein